MTRKEQRELKLRKETEFLNSIRDKPIDGKLKGEYRTTSFWKDFRNLLKKERKTDYLTGRKLTKTWNCHHMRFDPRLYTYLDKEFFRCYNNQIHDLVHLCVTETIKNPDFMKKLTDEVNLHIELNGNKDVRDFVKEVKNG